MSGAARWKPDQPYQDLPPLPPPNELETKPVLKRCILARAALAELKQAVELLPNPGMLINTLPMLEAQASSEIENIVTTADALFRQQSTDGDADPATKEALRYRHALLEGVAALEQRPLSTRIAEAVCDRIKGRAMGIRRVPGTAIVHRGTGQVIYMPPDGEARIRGMLANWEAFLHEEQELDPLVRMAVGHYQFEAIHPFADGNGRTGRVLNILYLVEQGLLPLPVLYLSRFIIDHKAGYYRSLLGVTADSDWEGWLIYMLKAVEETAAWTTSKIGAIRELSGATASYLRQTVPKIYSRELVDVLFQQPYCRIANLVDAGIVGRQAASRYLKELVRVGVLREERVGRGALFLHPKLLDLVTREGNQFQPYP